MSAIDRRMITVVMGNSANSAGAPNMPPVTPLSVAATLCERFQGARGVSLSSVFIATLSALDSASSARPSICD